jgi:hypothetical protein
VNKDRYQQLTMDESTRLTEEELQEGWHFCPEFDFLLTQGEGPEQVLGEPCVYCGFKYKGYTDAAALRE